MLPEFSQFSTLWPVHVLKGGKAASSRLELLSFSLELALTRAYPCTEVSGPDHREALSPCCQMAVCRVSVQCRWVYIHGRVARFLVYRWLPREGGVQVHNRKLGALQCPLKKQSLHLSICVFTQSVLNSNQSQDHTFQASLLLHAVRVLPWFCFSVCVSSC